MVCDVCGLIPGSADDTQGRKLTREVSSIGISLYSFLILKVVVVVVKSPLQLTTRHPLLRHPNPSIHHRTLPLQPTKNSPQRAHQPSLEWRQKTRNLRRSWTCIQTTNQRTAHRKIIPSPQTHPQRTVLSAPSSTQIPQTPPLH
jgi:hypothetical protein